MTGELMDTYKGSLVLAWQLLVWCLLKRSRVIVDKGTSATTLVQLIMSIVRGTT